MKRIIFILLPILAAACTDIVSEPPIHDDSFDHLSYTEKGIMVNILSEKLGGFRKGQPSTRAMDEVSLTPYIEDGDTLLYIAQYNDGWQLYSANTSTHMLLAESAEGKFNMNDPEMPPAMRSYIQGYVENVKYAIKNGIDTVDKSWGYLALTEEDMKQGNLMVSSEGQSKSVTYPEIPEGTWILLESEVISEDFQNSKKLIETEWNQNSPWNYYADEVLDTLKTYVKAPAGCVPVALAQYEYYTHNLNGIPATTADTAIPNDDGHTYRFSGNSSEVWNKMPTFNGIQSCKEVAILIGHIGKQLKADYKYNSTSVEDSKIIPYLKTIYNTVFSKADIDYSYIKSSIDKKYPIIAHASTSLATKSSQKSGAHMFLIDGYSENEKKIRYLYGLKRYPLPAGAIDPYESDQVDEYGNIVSYAYTNEIITTYTERNITMNWGYMPYENSGYFYTYANDWTAGGHVFSQDHWMLTRQDVK